MTAEPQPQPQPPTGLALLERAINYTLGSLHLVTLAAMDRPTPCRRWDLRALLGHMNESLATLDDAITVGRVHLYEAAPDPAVDPVGALRDRACRLMGSWTNTHRATIDIEDSPLTTGIVAAVGAVEVTVHGWDVGQACGKNRPIPPALAADLSEIAAALVTDADRPAHFATPVAVRTGAGPSERLLAFLGRKAR